MGKIGEGLRYMPLGTSITCTTSSWVGEQWGAWSIGTKTGNSPVKSDRSNTTTTSTRTQGKLFLVMHPLQWRLIGHHPLAGVQFHSPTRLCVEYTDPLLPAHVTNKPQP